MKAIKSVSKFCISSLFAISLMCDGAVAEEVSLKLENGLTALGSLDLAEGDQLKGSEIILLVHGTLAHKDMDFISGLRGILNERGLNVLAINLSLGLDQRSGMFDCAVPHTHKHRDAIPEIRQWVSWLEEQGASSVVLMGHSRGGNQVAWSAHKNPSKIVKSVISVAPMTYEPQRETVDYQRKNDKGLLQVLNVMMSADEKGLSTVVQDGYDFLYCKGAKVTAASFMDYYMADKKFNTPDLVQNLDLPVLIIAGDKDVVVDDLPYQMSKIKKTNIRFETVTDADHMFMDFASEDLADLVEAFVRQ